MKRFHFTLQAVHSWRERQEHASLGAYSSALTAARKVADRLAAIDTERQSFRADWLDHLRTGCAAIEVLHFQEHGAFLEGGRRACQRESDEAERQVQRALAEMLVARQKRELVDKLHHRLRQRHDIEAGRAEQRELDDLATTRYAFRAEAANSVAT